MLRLHPYEYHRPDTVEGALGLLAEHEGDAMPIAGGTDLVPNMKHKLFTPGHLVALRGVEELRGIGPAADGSDGSGADREGAGDDGVLRIGAGETLASVAAHPEVTERFPSLARACGEISGPQLRRMGTIGGNLCLDTRCTYYNQSYFWRKSLGFCLKKDGDECHVIPGGTRCVAAHSADTPPVLMTLGARVEIAGPEGRRTVPLDDFFTSDGVWNRKMEPGELVVAILLPQPPARTRFSFQKLRQRNSIDFPILNLAVAVDFDDDETIRDVRMIASAMGAYPRRIGKVDDAAVGNELTPSVIDAVAEQAFRQCHPLENIIVDPEWRRAMVPVLVRRALREIAA